MAANASAATKNPYIPVYDAGVKVYGELPSGGGTPGEPQVPGRPSGLQAEPGNASVALSWNAVSGATKYTVKRSLVSGGPYTTVGTATSAVYSDSGLTNGVDYYYVVTASNSVGESTASVQVSAKPREITVPAGALRVQYRTNDTSPGDSQIRSQFRIINTGTEAIPLSGLKLRYYYTVDGDKPQEFHCDYAAVGSGNLNGSFGKLSAPVTLADSYLEISFAAGAGSLAPGADSGEIQVRFNKSDWTAYNESNDYSYGGTQQTFADWNKVTLYRGGTLVWGLEP